MATPLDDTLRDMQGIRSTIKASLKAMRKPPLTAQELGAAVEVALDNTDTFLRDKPELSDGARESLENLLERLRDIERHLQDPKFYGSRARFLRRMQEIFSHGEDFCAPYRVALQSALEGLKKSLAIESNGDAQQVVISDLTKPPRAGSVAGDCQDDTLEARPAKQGSNWDTVVDAIQVGLQTVSQVTDFIPGPAGPIVKLMAGTGLSIIDLLNGVVDNREAASELGSHVGILVQTVVRFLETPASGQQSTVDQETVTQLRAFLDALKSVELSLRQLQSQSDFKQGVSYKSNKGDLQSWNTKIKRAFDQLQNCLSLHALRSLTKMTEVDALRERDRLLDRLGDGATGANDKAEEEADLICLPETRTEVLDELEGWLADPSGTRLLWLSGVAGCGKSAVVATIPHQHRLPTSSATFYFNRGAQERNQGVICSLSRQLAGLGHGSLERFVLEAVKAHPNISAALLATQFQELLINPLKKLVPGSHPILILMDGLDEWENHTAACKLVELVARAHSELPSTVRFVIASRNEQHLVSSMRSARVFPLVKRYELDGVPSDEVLNDIRIYMNKRFSDIRSNSLDPIVSSDNWPEKTHVEVLVNLSGGLFQWAATAMSYIGQRLPNDRLHGILDAPEEFRGLDGLYRGVFKSIFLDDTPPLVLQLLQKVLGFIVVALTPVDVPTITRLCADPVKPETMEFFQEEILARLASFLILPKQSSEPVTVSHKSIVDFATDPNRCTDLRLYIRPVDHHQRLAAACLTVLNQDLRHNICEIDDHRLNNSEVLDLVERRISSALRYMCRYWATHLSLAGYAGAAALSDLLDRFTGSSLMYWLEVMSLCQLIHGQQAAAVVQEALSWSSACTSPATPNSTTQTLLIDMTHFVSMFRNPIIQRAADIYTVALSLAPSEMCLRQIYFNVGIKGLRSIRDPCYKSTTKSLWVGEHIPKSMIGPPGSAVLASLTEDDSSTILWDAVTGGRLDHPGIDLRRVAFSPDAKTLASGSSGPDIRIWNIETMSQKGDTLQIDGRVESLAFSPDGHTLVSESDMGSVCLWNVKDQAQITCTPWVHTIKESTREEGVYERDPFLSPIIWSSNQEKLGYFSRRQTLLLWDMVAGAQIGEEWDAHGSASSFSSDGGILAVGNTGRGHIYLYDVKTRAQTAVLSRTTKYIVTHLLFAADDKMLASRNGDEGIVIWELEGEDRWRVTRLLEGYAGQLADIAFSYGTRMFASSAECTWDLETEVLRGKSGLTGHTSLVVCLAFSPDGRMLASGSIESSICLWDAELGIQTGHIKLDHSGLPMSLHYSDDGRKLVASHGKRVTSGIVAGPLPTSDTPSAPNSDVMDCGEIAKDGWVLYGSEQWFWLPISGGGWLLHGTCLAVRTGFCVFIFDVSGVMDMIPKDKTR